MLAQVWHELKFMTFGGGGVVKSKPDSDLVESNWRVTSGQLKEVDQFYGFRTAMGGDGSTRQPLWNMGSVPTCTWDQNCPANPNLETLNFNRLLR